MDWATPCMVMGGIGYTDIYPVERINRDLRLASIWTGTNEVMSMIVAGELFEEYHAGRPGLKGRNHELDAASAEAEDEKVFE